MRGLSRHPHEDCIQSFALLAGRTAYSERNGIQAFCLLWCNKYKKWRGNDPRLQTQTTVGPEPAHT